MLPSTLATTGTDPNPLMDTSAPSTSTATSTSDSVSGTTGPASALGPVRIPKSSSSSSFRRRRVPPDQRQRAEVSCDRCRVRKTRCVRLNGSTEACRYCARANLACVSQTPRAKPLPPASPTSSTTPGPLNRTHAQPSRSTQSTVLPEVTQVYQAKAKQISTRDDPGRAALSLLESLYPGRSLSTAEDVSKLGLELHKVQGANASPQVLDLTRPAPLQVPPAPSASSEHMSPSTPELPPYLYDYSHKFPEGHLLPGNPGGSYHYVGPSGSGQFANTIRALLAKRNFSMIPLSDRQFEEHKKVSEFLATPVIRTMETELPGHPATNAFSPPVERFDFPFLSSRPLLDRLVESFFERVHVNFPLFHRGGFQIQYESLWDGNDGGHFGLKQNEKTGWMSAFYMVLVLGAQGLESGDLPEATDLQAQIIAHIVRDRLSSIVLSPSVSHVQCLLLLQLYLHNAGQRNACWLILGHAGRMAIALGLHRLGAPWSFNAIERNTRRMVWWAYHIFEQHLSFALGRPTTTSCMGVTAAYPNESLLEYNSAPPGHLDAQVSLSDLTFLVKRFAADSWGLYADANELSKKIQVAEYLDQKLLLWAEMLPAHLQCSTLPPTSSHSRSILLLHAYYHHTRSVLYRAFLLSRANREIDDGACTTSGATDSPIDRCAMKSLEAGESALRQIVSLYKLNLLEGELWIDLYYFFHGILIAGLPFLSYPPTTPRDMTTVSVVEEAIDAVQRTRMSPTYRVLSDVAIRFAKLVGVYTGGKDNRNPGGMPSSGLTVDGPGRFEGSTIDLGQIFGNLFEPNADHEPNTSPTSLLNDLANGQSLSMNDGDFWDISKVIEGL